MNSCFYQLNSWGVLVFFFSKEKGSYFRATSQGQKLIKALKLEDRLQPLDFHFYELMEADGSSSFPAVYQHDLLAIINEVEKGIGRNEFVKRFGTLFGEPEKTALFFKKHADNLLERQVIVLKALARTAKVDGLQYHLPWSPFVPALAEYAAKKYGIAVVSRYSLADLFSQLVKLGHVIWMFIKGWALALFGSFRPAGVKALLGNLYTLKGFAFTDDKRSDFPWLLQFPGEKALLYFERKDLPVTGAMVEELTSRKIKAAALTAKATATAEVPVYRPSPDFIEKSKLIFKTIYYYFRYGGGLRPLNYLIWSLRFIAEYARYHDFYLQQGIKVNVDFVDFDPYRIARHLAVAANGGIGVSYQNSNWPLPNPILASGADVLFLFGPYYLARQRAVGSRCGRYLYSGYLTDYSFPAARTKGGELRKKLQAKGAKFIICYFDENSSDDSLSLIPNDRSAEVYRRLLSAVLADGSLGLICSPKRPKTLLNRIPEAAGLIDQAKATGRCVFLDGQYGTESYPAEPSQAADLTITLLLGGTTALECFLAGSRVVYLDLEKLYSYEEYQWGKGTLVFDDLEALMSAIGQVRRDPSVEIGRASRIPNLKEKDPFQDGQAAKRMAKYLECLLDAFNQGKGRNEALLFADEQFKKTWGSDKAINGFN
ncbi:MAG: hypothetical protein WCW67_02055 [Candidatus Margulisiibacteriota bacterium]